jgi:diaminopimelate epimerase
MTDAIEFAKLSGSGNDFICLDNRDGRFDDLLARPEAVGHFARLLCRRSLGIGADGVVFAGRPEIEGVADVSARFFEADGSEANLCGNGTACFTRWVIAGGFVPDCEVRILTPAGVVLAQNCDARYVRVCIPTPEDLQPDVEVTVRGLPMWCDYVVVGVPHVVVYVDDLAATDVATLGPALRHHARFQPRGVNANFVQVLAPGELAIRTWEFGVEGETLACGTGSASAAILAALRFDWPAEYFAGEESVRLRTRGGDVLRVSFVRQDGGTIDDVCLETTVRFLFRGSLTRELAAAALQPHPRGQ